METCNYLILSLSLLYFPFYDKIKQIFFPANLPKQRVIVAEDEIVGILECFSDSQVQYR